MQIDITKIGTRTIELPSFEGAKVVLKSALTVQEIEDMKAGIPQNSKDFDELLGEKMIVDAIKSWNLSAGSETLEISMKSLKLLPIKDFQFIVQEVTGNQKVDENGELLTTEEQKKAITKKP